MLLKITSKANHYIVVIAPMIACILILFATLYPLSSKDKELYRGISSQLQNYSSVDLASIAYERYVLSVSKINVNDPISFEKSEIKKSIFDSKLRIISDDTSLNRIYRSNKDYELTLTNIVALSEKSDEIVNDLRIGKIHKSYAINKIEEIRPLIERIEEITYKAQVDQFDTLIDVLQKNKRKVFIFWFSVVVLMFVFIIIMVVFLRKQSQLIKQKDEVILSKNIFISAIRHELTTPLQTITYGVELLSSEHSDRSKRISDEICRASERISSHMSELADYSRLELGVIQANKDVFFIGDLIEDVLKSYETLNNGNKIVYVNGLLHRNVKIVADKWRVRKVLDNILSNSLKFTKDGHVGIVWRLLNKKDGCYLCVLVRDNGIGFDLSDSNKIFEPFVRLKSAGNTSGMGLGLAIVKHTINLLEGVIRAKGREKEGCSFFFTVKIGLY